MKLWGIIDTIIKTTSCGTTGPWKTDVYVEPTAPATGNRLLAEG